MHTGVRAANRVEEILILDADVIAHYTRIGATDGAHNEGLIRILESDKNVISINRFFSFAEHEGAESMVLLKAAHNNFNVVLMIAGLTSRLHWRADRGCRDRTMLDAGFRLMVLYTKLQWRGMVRSTTVSRIDEDVKVCLGLSRHVLEPADSLFCQGGCRGQCSELDAHDVILQRRQNLTHSS